MPWGKKEEVFSRAFQRIVDLVLALRPTRRPPKYGTWKNDKSVFVCFILGVLTNKSVNLLPP